MRTSHDHQPERTSLTDGPRNLVLAPDLFVEMCCVTVGPPVELKHRLSDQARFRVFISPPVLCALRDGMQQRGHSVADAKAHAASVRECFHHVDLDEGRPLVEHLIELAARAEVIEVYTADDALLTHEGSQFVTVGVLLSEFL